MADPPPRKDAHEAHGAVEDPHDDAGDAVRDNSLDAAEETIDEAPHRFEDDPDDEEADQDVDEAKDGPKDDGADAEVEPQRNQTAGQDADCDVEMTQPSQAVTPWVPPLSVGAGGTLRFRRIVSDTATGAAAEEASSWLKRVLVDGPRAVAEILSIVVSPCALASSGTGDLITQQMVMANDPAATVLQLCVDLEHGVKDVAGELVASRRARSAYQEFWMRVARESSDAILYDTDCFDTVLSWLEVMSTAKLSMLRYSACLAAYSIVDGFIALGSKLRARLVSLQRQLDTEKKRCEKGSSRRGRKGPKGRQVTVLSQKGKDLTKKVDDLSANNGELIELADKVFTGIFVLKYRDVAPEIRVASVQYLGKWIMRHPDHYLDDTHSKYIGWLLSDKDSTVRRACVSALSEMLQQPDFFPSLELFLRRFLSRIVEMCRDKDNDVSMRAIRLCSLLIPFEILDQDSVDQLSEQVMEESNSGIRKAAGQFVMSLISDEEPASATSKKGDKDAPSRIQLSKRKQLALLASEIPPREKAKEQIRELVLIVARDGAVNVNSELVHDAMWEVMPSLRSWEAYVALLGEGQEASNLGGRSRASKARVTVNADVEEALDEEEKALVCELLLASAKEVVKEDQKLTPKQMEKSDKESCEDALARIFAPLIPRLLVQFQGSARAVAALVQVPRYFAAKHFEAALQKKHFVSLLSRLVDAISRHTGSENVMHATVDTFRVMNSDGHPLKTLTSDALLKASIAASKDLHQLVVAGVQDTDPITVGSVLLKTRVISELVELPDSTLADALAVVSTITDKDLSLAFNTTIVVDAIHTAVRQWVWAAGKIHAFCVGNKADENFDAQLSTQAKELWDSRDAVLARLAKVAEYPFSLRIRVTAARVLLTVLTLSSGISRVLSKQTKIVMKTRDDINGKDNEVHGESKSAEETMTQKNVEDKMEMNADQSKSFDQWVVVVKECVMDLIIAESGFPARNPKVPKSHESRKGTGSVPEEETNYLCRSMVQACMQGAVSEQFMHLPFLGLLLCRKNSTRSVERVCQLYRAHVSDRRENAHELALQAINDAADIETGKRESKHHAAALLARAMIDTAPDNDKEIFYVKLLQSLLTSCKYSLGDVEKAKDAVSLLAKTSSFLMSRVSVRASAEILEAARDFEASIKESESLEEGDQSELTRLVFPIIMALEAVNTGTPRALPHLKKGPAKGVSKRTKPKEPRISSNKEWEGSPRVAVAGGSQELRRSARVRKPRVLTNFEESSDGDESDVHEDEVVAEDEDDSGEELPATPPPRNEEGDAVETEEEAKMASGSEAGDPFSKQALNTNRRLSKSTPNTKAVRVPDEDDDEENEGEPEKEKEQSRSKSGTPQKRGRGRPKKTSSKRRTAVRGRGRPKKNAVPPEERNTDKEKEDVAASKPERGEEENGEEEHAIPNKSESVGPEEVLGRKAKSSKRLKPETKPGSEPVVRRKRQRRW